MNILWIKDGKIGHEKQVKALLDEISKTEDIKVFEEEYKISKFKRFSNVIEYFLGSFYNFDVHGTFKVSGIYDYSFSVYDKKDINIIIGAGASVHNRILEIKRHLKISFNKNILSISVLVPDYFKKDFDIICAPFHDTYKLPVNDNVLYFEGSLANVSNREVDEGIGLIGIGGKNKHYKFDESKLIQQIEYVASIYPNKKWHIFSSRRTTTKMLNKLNLLSNNYNNIVLGNNGFGEIIKKASIKVVTQDSMNMVYESLSTKGKTFLFNMNYFKKNKITNQIDELLKNRQVGYLESSELVGGLLKISMQQQNEHHEVFAEVEKLSYKLIQKIAN
jgi:mitochondrial fission protein ELM1